MDDHQVASSYVRLAHNILKCATRREVRTSEEPWGANSTLPDLFTGHLLIRHKQFAFALADDYLEFRKSILGKRRLSLLPYLRESSIRTNYIGPGSSSLLIRFLSWREATGSALRLHIRQVK